MKINAGLSGREVIALQKVDSLLAYLLCEKLKRFSAMQQTRG
jgi:hypothetical protein